MISTRDPGTGLSAGLIASAVIPVAMDPPSMLISINRSASAHQFIARAGKLCINLLSIEQAELVKLFTDPLQRDQRFSGTLWSDSEGIPYLLSSCSNIFCRTRTTVMFGTHEIFITEVFDVRGSDRPADPLGWIDGDFARLRPL
ncbi:flavin reductase family protein [Sphingobium sp. 15-1]|uniref:flavin reductase family protein n=1 Tax=Sphingobium sp. 15-1 TaxID=2729616 RepID=UPI002100D8D1|nr:flavin reductase family protein [Sphingobium sp. 15-1]